MKAQEKLERVDATITKSVEVFTLLFLVALLVILGIEGATFTTPETRGPVLVATCIIGWVAAFPFVWWIHWYVPRQWKRLFREEFSDMNIDALEKTVAHINTEGGCHFSYVARMVVISIQDERDGDTFLRNPASVKAKKIYRSLLPKES